jgi:hypothetical protein
LSIGNLLYVRPRDRLAHDAFKLPLRDALVFNDVAGPHIIHFNARSIYYGSGTFTPNDVNADVPVKEAVSGGEDPAVRWNSLIQKGDIDGSAEDVDVRRQRRPA